MSPRLIYSIIEKRLDECAHQPTCIDMYQDIASQNYTWIMVEDNSAMQYLASVLD